MSSDASASSTSSSLDVARVFEQCEWSIDGTLLKNGGGWDNGDLDSSLLYCVYHLIVLDPENMRVLVEVLPAQRVRIPYVVKTNSRKTVHSYNEIEALVESVVGPRTRLLRLLWEAWHQSKNREDLPFQFHLVYVMDTEEASRNCRAPWEWIDEKDLSRYEWIERCDEFDVGRIVEDLFQEANTHEDQSGVRLEPWYLVGWYGKAMSWIRSELEAKGIHIVSSVCKEMVRRGIGYFMQCDISGRSHGRGVKRQKEGEKLYIKCTLPRFREAERTAAVGRVIGDIAAEVLGLNKDLGVMLLRDAGKLEVQSVDGDALIETLVGMQRKSANRLDELIGEGVEVRDGKWLEENIDQILNHPAFGRYRDEWSVEDEMEYLRSKVKFIQTAGRNLAVIGAPNTLVHGDFRFHNIGKRSTEGEKLYRVFDWEYSHIGSPFDDYLTLKSEIDLEVKKGNIVNMDRAKLWEAVDKAFKRVIDKAAAYDNASFLCLIKIVGDTHRVNQTLEYFEHQNRKWCDSNTNTIQLLVELLFDSVKALEHNAHYRSIQGEGIE